MESSIIYDRFRFAFYKFHSGSSGEDGLVKTRGRNRPVTALERDDSLSLGERMKIKMIRDEGPGMYYLGLHGEQIWR